ATVDDLEIGIERGITDPIPTLQGINRYRLILRSALGAELVHSAEGVDPEDDDEFAGATVVEVAEDRLAFLTYGPGYAHTIAFYGNLALGSAASRDEVVE